MKRCLDVICIVLVLLFFPHCGREKTQQMERQGSETHAALAEIDSLMWRQPDSAFVLLQEFVVSPEAEKLDTFDGHYCQVLISELLYKNDFEQTNRKELLQAVAYFDSITQVPEPVVAEHGRSVEGPSNRIAFLSARAHYINGVGYYENDSVVEACKEYMKALEVMENRFQEKDLVGEKARFMALTYTHLAALFSDLYLHEQTIYFAQCSLPYYRKLELPRWHLSWVLNKIGTNYDMMEKLDSADCYYRMAMSVLDDTNTILFRDIATYMEYKKDSLQADVIILQLKKLLLQSENNTERLARCAFIGELCYHEKLFDSAWHYLNMVYCETSSIVTKKQAAERLAEISKVKGRISEMHEYTEFLVPFANQEENQSEIKSQLTELYKTYSQKRLERQHKKEIGKHNKQMLIVIVGILFMTLIISLLYFKNRQRKQKLETLIESERHAHKMNQAALSGRLKRSNKELRELKGQLGQREDATATAEQAALFTDEPICRLIMDRVNEGQFKSKVDYVYYKDYALDKQQLLDLRLAADRHFGQFTVRLKKAYPELTNSDLDYCCLYLLGLTDADIAALMQKAYSTVSDRSRKLKAFFDMDEPLSTSICSFAYETIQN